MLQTEDPIILRGGRAHSQLYAVLRDLIQMYVEAHYARSRRGYDSLLLTKCQCVLGVKPGEKYYTHYVVRLKVPGRKGVVGAIKVTLGVSSIEEVDECLEH